VLQVDSSAYTLAMTEASTSRAIFAKLIAVVLACCVGSTPGCPHIDPRNLHEHLVQNCPTREVVDEMLAMSGGTKDAFFHRLNTAFPALHGLRDTGLRLKTTAKACFIGDSIVRELAAVWERLAPNASFVHQQTTCSYLMTEASAGRLSKVQRQVAGGRMAWLKESNCDVILAGGLGPHCLRRLVEAAPATELSELPVSLEQHRQHVAGYLEALHEVAASTHVPVIFIGSPVIEGDILILDPPKGDWDDFHDFSLSKLWAFDEKAVFDETYGDDAPAAAATAGPAPMLRMLYLARFHLDCPGYRCDGMHNDNAILSCRGNPGFVDFLLADMLESSGVLARLAEMRKADGACHFSRTAGEAPAHFSPFAKADGRGRLHHHSKHAGPRASGGGLYA